MAEYFFELLTEEIPAWMHDAAQSALLTPLRKLADELNVPTDGPATVLVNSTPRRIVVLMTRVPFREEDREEEVKGPPRKAAYDAEGKPTKALDGFLKKNNASVDDLIDDSKEGGDYVRIKRLVAGRASGEILQQRIPQIVESLRWPKMMRWGAGEHAYIRPIHSLISIFDGQSLPIEIFGVKSGTTTTGHRTLSPRKLEVGSYNEYVTKLELARVIVDHERRKLVMAQRALVLAQQAGGKVAEDVSIWAQWQYLTEYPGVVRAEFRPEYLALPDEVLVTVMRVHQKQLPIRDASDKLTNSFLAVLDNESDPEGNAAYGNSFVTNARFADAKFFYDVDRKTPLEMRMEQLSHLQVHAQLGNYADKTAHIARIAEAICKEIGADKVAADAAVLCKCDLVTEMVKEFTDLQGRIGGIYAREEGQPDDVWQAIYDHYLPINLEDPLPRTLSGCVLSLADKIQTLADFFRIGAKPTGSKDPYALRRAAQGIVQILLNRDKRQVKIGIDKLIEIALRHPERSEGSQAAQSEILRSAQDDVARDLHNFFADRVRNILEISNYKFAYDEIAAAMEAGWAQSLTDLVDRVQAVRSMRNESAFLSLLDSAKRIENITAGHDSINVDAKKLEHASERRLNELGDTVIEHIDELIAQREYLHALESFGALAPELEKFFDDVMVNVDDAELRRNRMSLLRKVGGAVTRIADVTKIVVDRSEYRS